MSKVIRITAEGSIPQDAVNVFHFRIPGAGSQATEVIAAITAVQDFYEAVDAYLRMGTITIGARVVTVDQTPNQIIPATPASVISTGSTPTTLSASVVCSYRGVNLGARYRGRIYLGPIELDQQSTDGATWDNTFIGVVSAAWADLIEVSANSIEFGVWSKRYNAFTPAVASSVSTAIGTQRRRLK